MRVKMGYVRGNSHRDGTRIEAALLLDLAHKIGRGYSRIGSVLLGDCHILTVGNRHIGQARTIERCMTNVLIARITLRCLSLPVELGGGNPVAETRKKRAVLVIG